ncbi:Two component regulator propeller [compost metagenome]
MGRQAGVYCYFKKANYKKFVNYNLRQYPKTIFKDSNNTMWISLQKDEYNQAKLYCIKNNSLKLVKIVKDNISFIAQYDANTLYFGSEKGLFKYKIDSGNLSFIKNTEGFNIRSIFIDNEKKIWLTTYEKGFFLYSDNKLYSNR